MLDSIVSRLSSIKDLITGWAPDKIDEFADISSRIAEVAREISSYLRMVASTGQHDKHKDKLVARLRSLRDECSANLHSMRAAAPAPTPMGPLSPVLQQILMQIVQELVNALLGKLFPQPAQHEQPPAQQHEEVVPEAPPASE